MSDHFIGEIMISGFNFAPSGWALCNGQLYPISQNTALFSLLGTQFGGDGRTNFAIPNFQGRAPIHQGQGPGLTQRQVGESGGVETVAIDNSTMPAHAHLLNASSNTADQVSPVGMIPASESSGQTAYYGTRGSSAMAPDALTPVGQSQPHDNVQPYLTLNFTIALTGIFPARS
ncbi:MAG: tail fiber protein [Armatimonadota bacterium]